MIERYADFLKKMESFKKENEENLLKAKENPEEYLKKMGLDGKDIDEEKLKEFVKSLEDNVSKLGSVQKFNKESNAFKRFDGFQKSKINGQEPTNENILKLFSFFTELLDETKSNSCEECFHFDKENCSEGVINAHSLQKRGALIELSSPNGKSNELKVLQFSRSYKESDNLVERLINIKEASVFRGFCDSHDKIFLDTIEKKDFIGNEKQMFFHSYRSFAYSFNKLNEWNKYLIHNIEESLNPIKGLMDNVNDFLSTLGMETNKPVISLEKLKISEQQKQQLEVQSFSKYKAYLNNYLEGEDYSQLEHIQHSVKHKCPVACSSWVILHCYSNNGFFINVDEGDLYVGSPCMLTVLPEGDKTIIILSRFRNDLNSHLIFNQLKGHKELDIYLFEKAITNIIFEQVENFFIAPLFWNSLSNTQKESILNDVNKVKPNFPYEPTFEASINLFDEKYRLN
jgi:hypothetical protein